MGRPRRNVARGNKKVKEDTKEENTTVDTNTEGFYRDDVDKFHDEKEKLLLDAERDDASSDEQSGSDEEVFGLHLSDDEEEELEGDGKGKEEREEDDQVATETFYASDDEDGEEDQQPELSDKAWGQSKKAFYNTDDVEGMEGSEEEEEAAELEEKEAMMLQKRLAAELDHEDFAAVDIALEEEKAIQELQGQEEKVVKDLSKLSSAEKMAILEKDSPELVGLLSEFQDKLAHIATTLQPVLAGAKQFPNLLTELGEKYLETKLHLCQCYCLNILFYLLLKSNRVPVLNHPVIEVIVKIRQLMDKLHPTDESLNDELEEALRCVRNNCCSGITSGAAVASSGSVQEPQGTKGGKEARSKKRKLVEGEAQDVGVAKGTPLTSVLKKQKVGPPSKCVSTVGDEDGEDPLDYYYKVKAMKEKKVADKANRVRIADVEESEEQDKATDGKRAINYQISKNKGLVPKRKKEQRNPRVKHRKKFEKAKIKHKSQVHPVMPELQRYGGEKTGIRSTLSRSIRIK